MDETLLRQALYQFPKYDEVKSLFDTIRHTIMLPHQSKIMPQIHRRNGRALIANDMGTGKTLLASTTTLWYINEWPSLVSCDAVASLDWFDHFVRFLKIPPERIRRWTDTGVRQPYTLKEFEADVRAEAAATRRLNACYGCDTEQNLNTALHAPNEKLVTNSATNIFTVLQRLGLTTTDVRSRKEIARKTEPQPWIHIVSHQKVARHIDTVMKYDIQCAIFDECDVMRNWYSGTTRALTRIGLNAKRLLLLSGSPLERHLDLFPQFHVIRPDLFRNIDEWVDAFCDPVVTWIDANRYTVDRRGSHNADMLREFFTNFIGFRVRKCDIDIAAAIRNGLHMQFKVHRYVAYIELDDNNGRGDGLSIFDSVSDNAGDACDGVVVSKISGISNSCNTSNTSNNSEIDVSASSVQKTSNLKKRKRTDGHKTQEPSTQHTDPKNQPKRYKRSTTKNSEKLVQITEVFNELLRKQQEKKKEQNAKRSTSHKSRRKGESIASQINKTHDSTQQAQEVQIDLDELAKSREFCQTLRKVMQCKKSSAGRFILQYIKDRIIVDQTSKLLVYCDNHIMIDYMYGLICIAFNMLDKSGGKYKCVKVDGRVRHSDRDAAITAIQNDPGTRVGVLGIGAAAKSITLTACNHVVFVQMVLNARQHIQAECRLVRIGQTRDVYITYLISTLPDGSETIEITVFDMILAKCNVLSRAMDGIDMDFPVKYLSPGLFPS